MNLDDTLVVIDTCVLLKPRLSDVLMDLRAEKLFSAHWNATIEDEFLRNMQHVFDVPARAAQARLNAMKRRCPECDVPLSLFDLNAVPAGVHKADAHVAATALTLRRYVDEAQGESGDAAPAKVYIVTENLRHMAREQMRRRGVEVLKAGAFLDLVYENHPEEAGRAVLQAARDLTRPPYTREELLWNLQEHGAKSMVVRLAAAWGVVPVKKELAAPAGLPTATTGAIGLRLAPVAGRTPTSGLGAILTRQAKRGSR